MLKVRVLYPGLDGVEGCGDRDRRDGTRDGGDEVLSPCGLVVVLDAEEVVFCDGRRAEELQAGGSRVLSN